MALGAHALVERRAHVHADRLDTGGAVGSELVEERVEGGGVLALSAPHDLLGGVVGDQGEVVMAAFPVMWVILVKGFRKDFLMNFCRVVDAQGDLAL